MGLIRSALLVKVGQSIFRRVQQSRKASGGASGSAGQSRGTGKGPGSGGGNPRTR